MIVPERRHTSGPCLTLFVPRDGAVDHKRCEGVTQPEDRAVVSMSETSIFVNGVPYLVEGADARFIYARLDRDRADPIQREYFPNRSLAVDREQGRIVEFKDPERSFAEGNAVEWSCRAVKAWTGGPE